jgi:hypothetical protein
MEQTIPALLIAAILIIAGVLIAGVTNSSVQTVNDSWREMEAISEERLGTDLTVISTQVSVDTFDVTMVVLNEGRTPLDEFDHMDLIISYDGADLQRYNTWLPYTEATVQPSNTWKLMSILNDFHNPGIVDTGEQATLMARVSPGVLVGPDRWIVLSTETGVAYTVYF